MQKRSGTLNLEVRTVGPEFAFESLEKQNSEFKPNSEARHKQLRSEKLPLTSSVSCSKSKTSSISNQVDSAIYPTNKEVKMNEDLHFRRWWDMHRAKRDTFYPHDILFHGQALYY